jgi:hypothetical protein
MILADELYVLHIREIRNHPGGNVAALWSGGNFVTDLSCPGPHGNASGIVSHDLLESFTETLHIPVGAGLSAPPNADPHALDKRGEAIEIHP